MKVRLVLAALAGMASTSAFAQSHCDKSYAFEVNVSGVNGQSLCSSSALRFIDGLQNFNTSNSAYTNTSAANVLGRFNDVNLQMSYGANSTTLNYNFVELSHAGSFTGATREDSQKLFEDYIKKNGIIGEIMNYQAKNSPTSPITGVGGLIPMTIAADFNSSFTNSPTTVAGPTSSGGSSNNLIGVGLSYGSYSVSSTSERISTTSIPLSYTIRNDIDPRRQLSFSLPITLIQLGDTKTVQTGLGISYRFPLSDQWTITPNGKYSVVASADRATVATVYSASLTSTYVIPLSSFDISIGNMIGYYATGKFSAGDYSFDPGIKNTAMRNGVMLSQPVNLGKKMTVEYSVIDTRYFGDKPFINNFQEYGITLGTNKSAQDVRSALRGGLTYMQGPGTKGFTANFGFWF